MLIGILPQLAITRNLDVPALSGPGRRNARLPRCKSFISGPANEIFARLGLILLT